MIFYGLLWPMTFWEHYWVFMLLRVLGERPGALLRGEGIQRWHVSWVFLIWKVLFPRSYLEHSRVRPTAVGMSFLVETTIVMGHITSCHAEQGIGWLSDVDGIQKHCVGIVGWWGKLTQSCWHFQISNHILLSSSGVYLLPRWRPNRLTQLQPPIYTPNGIWLSPVLHHLLDSCVFYLYL